jgi:hypothetical protein
MTAPLFAAGPTRSRTANPYERTLWALTSTLLLGSVAAMVWSQDVFSSHNQGWSGAAPADLQIAQVVSSIAPSALTSGFLLVGVALAIRAVVHERLTVATHPVPESNPTPALDSDASFSAPVTPVVFETKRDRPTPVDHSLYMRPHERD